MIISRENTNECDTIELKVNNELIEPVKSIKYLGILTDNKLKFDEHIEFTVQKIAKQIRFMKRSCKVCI